MTPEQIKALRKRLGDTQAAFGLRLGGVSPQAISQLELGLTRPSTLMLASLKTVERMTGDGTIKSQETA